MTRNQTSFVQNVAAAPVLVSVGRLAITSWVVALLFLSLILHAGEPFYSWVDYVTQWLLWSIPVGGALFALCAGISVAILRCATYRSRVIAAYSLSRPRIWYIAVIASGFALLLKGSETTDVDFLTPLPGWWRRLETGAEFIAPAPTILALAVSYLVISYLAMRRGRQMFSFSGLCWNCGYERGSQTVCSECGAGVDNRVNRPTSDGR